MPHGINSNDETWNITINYLQTSWTTQANNRFHVVLNARGGDTTLYLLDAVIPVRSVNGDTVNQLSISNIYAIDFQNFWNRDASDPRILLHSDNTPGANQSSSNESAIYKQGYGLKKCIEAVLNATQSEKVILVGHSMGGLAIREYLQRIENGKHKWWIDSNDNNGHKIAKVVTFGTPNLGSNTSFAELFNIDPNCEAMRDLRYSYTGIPKAPYLFGNSEAVVPNNYYNKDVNCNGLSDSIIGISNLTSYNSVLPLPENVSYTWMTSNYLNLGGDIVVDVNKQWLYESGQPRPLNISDTILTNKRHDFETGDYRSIIRGLDEPDNSMNAYKIFFNKTYSGFITAQSFGVNLDIDFYKISIPVPGNLNVSISGFNAGFNEIAFMTNSGSVVKSKTISGGGDTIMSHVAAGDYFVRIKGSGNQNINFNSYNFYANLVAPLPVSVTLSLEGFFNAGTNTLNMNDTLTVLLRNTISPYEIIDSAKGIIDSLTFTGQFLFESAPAGTYYIVVKHRNSIEAWSKPGGEIYIVGQSLSYDFTNSITKAFGNNLILKGSKYSIFSGDVNQDGIIDASDLSLVDNAVFNAVMGYVNTDVNGDNFVDASDLSIVDNNVFRGVILMRP